MGETLNSPAQDNIDIIYKWYELEYLPDLSLKRYAAFVGKDPLPLFPYLLQPLHRLCLLYNFNTHLIFTCDPTKAEGRKFTVYLGFSGDKTLLENATLDRLLRSSQLAAYFPLEECCDESVESLKTFCNGLKSGGTVTKSEYFPKASPELGELLPGEGGLPKIYVERGFHHVRQWKKINKNCRLIALSNLMLALAVPCMYRLTLEPTEMANALQELYEQENMGPLYYLERMGRKPYKSPTMDSEPVPDNTREIKKYFEDALDDLQKNPHTLARIEFWSDVSCPAAPRLMAEMALSEAVEESVYKFYQYDDVFKGTAYPEHGSLVLPTDQRTPAPLRFLPSLFTVTEIMPFFRFPVLYEGEWIGMFKETDPAICLQNNKAVPIAEAVDLGEIIEIGKANKKNKSLLVEFPCSSKRKYEFPLEELAKHALVVGMPGSGKTNTLMQIVHTVSSLNEPVPFMIIEPAKREHRGLLNLIPDNVRLFTPGNPSPGLKGFKLRLNIFAAPVGFPIAEHINNLRAAFEGAISMPNPLPFLLDKALYNAYLEKEIDPLGVMPEILPNGLPCLEDLNRLMRNEVKLKGYKGELGNNITAILDARFDSLIFGLNNDVFNSLSPTFTHEELLRQSMIVETESLGKYGNLLALLLFTQLREALSVTRSKDKRKLRHLLVIEEAHNIIGPSAATNSTSDNANPKVAATEYLIKMLAEVRALGQGIIIADQIPSALADEVIKNTNLKICHRLTHIEERGTMGKAMLATDQQIENMATLQPGLTLVTQEKMLKPFQVQIKPVDGDKWRHLNQPSNDKLVKFDSGALDREKLEEWRDEYSKYQSEYKKRSSSTIAEGASNDRKIVLVRLHNAVKLAASFQQLLIFYPEFCNSDPLTAKNIESYYKKSKTGARYWLRSLCDDAIEDSLLDDLLIIIIRRALTEYVFNLNDFNKSIDSLPCDKSKIVCTIDEIENQIDSLNSIIDDMNRLLTLLPDGCWRELGEGWQTELSNCINSSKAILLVCKDSEKSFERL